MTMQFPSQQNTRICAPKVHIQSTNICSSKKLKTTQVDQINNLNFIYTMKYIFFHIIFEQTNLNDISYFTNFYLCPIFLCKQPFFFLPIIENDNAMTCIIHFSQFNLFTTLFDKYYLLFCKVKKQHHRDQVLYPNLTIQKRLVLYLNPKLFIYKGYTLLYYFSVTILCVISFKDYFYSFSPMKPLKNDPQVVNL